MLTKERQRPQRSGSMRGRSYQTRPTQRGSREDQSVTVETDDAVITGHLIESNERSVVVTFVNSWGKEETVYVPRTRITRLAVMS